MTKIVDMILRKYPLLKDQLEIAHLPLSPRRFVQQCLSNTLVFALMLTLVGFFLFSKVMPLWGYPLVFVLLFLFFFRFFMNLPVVYIRRRQRDIDREVLFAGRFLLIKLRSGIPIFNTFIEASKTYGVGAKYFKEIVDDVNTGMPIEKAMDRAIKYCASRKLRKILTQVNNALRLGIDVSGPLESVLKELTAEQFSEIQAYSKKLNSVSLIYMLMAILVPSIGVTFAMVMVGLTNLRIDSVVYVLIIGMIAFIQLVFISIFRNIRPAVNL
ncbi:type II secretion system F family protein [Candidatus Woesearchaeota archaeon]|nr:MAG: hypothetical protein QS99_C0006G0040 [archaeon GW2011_AR4]MBS3129633.1 type II secretion system F family protein [Candidatus Woesearchaeota archaeon]HIH37658.1 type II secretion system F family protein [Candidatus Woesearchaeota archaeon]HIH48819.1 type II secretion system F family protein [Candidatus Woesearchaeota archaeon]HIJ02943.1 type II secretion system F family protein [Candidatus Woesearchaeota archaeon]